MLLSSFVKVKYRNDCSHSNIGLVSAMVNEGKGRLFRRKDDKYLIYIPKDLAEDSMFPFRGASSVSVIVKFKLGEEKLIIEKLKEENE